MSQTKRKLDELIDQGTRPEYDEEKVDYTEEQLQQWIEETQIKKSYQKSNYDHDNDYDRMQDDLLSNQEDTGN